MHLKKSCAQEGFSLIVAKDCILKEKKITDYLVLEGEGAYKVWQTCFWQVPGRNHTGGHGVFLVPCFCQLALAQGTLRYSVL